jgi:hypothetical protein
MFTAFLSPTNLRLLVEDLLDLLDETLLLVVVVGTMGTGTVLLRLGLGNGVVLGCTLSTS